ncbi:HAD family hydrolase [candidate division WWE3 bacterium]|uniref:HAD family hydrolase n=1 Tax=candidate division WWE3 bacterium TaxID=2053526 RepID=A0A955RPQ2_UNCKA|nr:HAD family hydrolase [candidate division WWE3 bacterium]
MTAPLFSLFKQWLKQHGISLVLFDFDDTLIKTHDVFSTQIQLVYDYLEQILKIERDEIDQAFQQFNREAFEKHSVIPFDRWQYVILQLQEKYQFSDEVRDHCLGLLMEIYDILPEIFDGVIELLAGLKAESIPVALITHANEKWTNNKLDGLHLRRFFDAIHIVDERGKKTADSWRQAIAEHGVEPQQVLGIGDNVKGDIIAARQAGVQKLVWFNRGIGWSVYLEGELPEGVIEINAIDALIPNVLAA